MTVAVPIHASQQRKLSSQQPRPRNPQSEIQLADTGASVSDVGRVAELRLRVRASAAAESAVRRSRAAVERALKAGEPVYGLNTGVGSRRDEQLPRDVLLDYQNRLVSSHAGAIGAPLPDADVRAAMFARAVGIARGGSGASPAVFDALIGLLNAEIHPLVPELGSVGASDLGHMSAIAAVLTGGGQARLGDEVLPGSVALSRAGLAPVVLLPKDGIALISSNAVSIGTGALAVLQAERVARLADLAGALTLEALAGNLSPFHPEVHRAKRLAGQAASAAHMRSLLRGSHVERPEVASSLQDALSIRTIPQVHGAFRDQIAASRQAVTVELGGRGDNPLISAAGRAISNGNFHPMAMALSFEPLRLGVAHVGILAERRIGKLTTARHAAGSIEQAARSRVPAAPQFTVPYLLEHSASLLSGELRRLAVPVSLNPPSLASGQEDHATAAPQAVGLSRAALERLELLLAIEVLLAADLLTARQPVPALGRGTAWAYELATELVRRADPHDSAAQLVELLRGGLVDRLRADRRPSSNVEAEAAA